MLFPAAREHSTLSGPEYRNSEREREGETADLNDASILARAQAPPTAPAQTVIQKRHCSGKGDCTGTKPLPGD